jgi:hypothetical protein
MALQIDIDGYGILANCDGISDSAGGTWSEQGGGTIALSNDVYLFGGSAIGGKYASKSGVQQYDVGAGNELDFSPGGTEEGQLIYMWIAMTALGTLDTIANNALAIRLSHDAIATTNYSDWVIAGNNDANGWTGGWQCFVLDPRTTPTRTGTAGVTLSSVRTFGIWIDCSTSARADSIFNDQITVGRGIVTAGTSTTGFKDVVDYCTDYATARAFGQWQEREGIYYTYGTTTIGGSGTANTSFSDSGRVIQFGTSQFYNGSIWTSTFDASGSGLLIEDTGSYTTTFQDGVIVGSDSGRSGTTFIGNDDQDLRFNFYGGNNTGSVTKLYGTQIKSAYGEILFGDDADHHVYSTSFIDSTQVVTDAISGSPVMRNCIFAETADLSGALLWTDDIDIENSQFIANTTGPAIQVPISGTGGEIDFTNLLFSGNTYDVFNTSTVPITANKLGTTDASSYHVDGDVVTFYASYSHTLIGLELNTEVTYVLTGGGDIVFHEENATVSDGAGKYKTVYTHGGGEIVDVLVHHLDYQPDVSCIYDLTLPSTNTIVKIAQFPDLNTTW